MDDDYEKKEWFPLQTTNIPGPKGLPLAGSLFQFKNNSLEFLRKMTDQYGDLVKIRLGPTRYIYLVNHPDYFKEILTSKAGYFQKSLALQIAKKFLGDGLLTSEGNQHMRQRRLMQPAFQPRHIEQYAQTMVALGERMVENWRDGEKRKISEDMMDVTLRIIVKTMFSLDYNQDTHQIGRALEVGLKYVMNRARSIVPVPDNFPTPQNVRFKKAARVLNETIFSIIDERRKNGSENNGDLLSVLLAARDEEDGKGMTDRQVRDQVMTIFLAGHETTANTLSWTWYLLSQHPEVEQKFWHELDSVLEGRSPTIEDVNRLTYTRYTIQESMRLYPAAWIIGRQALDEVDIGEHHFEKGDTLMMSQYVMHRNPRYFENPDAFRPERFDGDLLERIPQYAYFPFGGGPRVCIGNHFAMLEATLLLAVIGQKFKLRLSENHHPVIPEPLITLRPKNGLYMNVFKR